MNIKTAVFCFSASPVIGSGHSIRCYALSEVLKDTGWDIKFILGKETIATVPYLLKHTESIYATYDSVNEIPDILSGMANTEILILDDYLINKKIETACRNYVNKIVVIEDIPSRAHDCDLLIDQTPGRNVEEYKSLLPDHITKLLGSKYVLLRKDFLDLRCDRWNREKHSKTKKSLLISYGSLDEHDLVCKTVDIIKKKEIDVTINIIISSSSRYIEKIKQYKDNIPNINLYVDTNNVAEIMSKSDFAVGAAGLSSLERCSLGLPSVIIETSDNQRELSKGLEKIDCVYYLGKVSNLDWESVGNSLKVFLNDDLKLKQMSTASMLNIDGHGAMRVAVSLLPKSNTIHGDVVNLRLADFSDEHKIYEWQILPETRKYSKNTDAPTIEEHHKWFIHKMNSEKSVQTIIQCNGRDIGVLRFDQDLEDNNTYVISIYVDPKEYGKGIGTQALMCGKDLFPEKKLLAEVMDENIASKKMFTKAGFSHIAAGLYQLSTF